jgi:hypothetical protein
MQQMRKKCDLLADKSQGFNNFGGMRKYNTVWVWQKKLYDYSVFNP